MQKKGEERKKHNKIVALYRRFLPFQLMWSRVEIVARVTIIKADQKIVFFFFVWCCGGGLILVFFFYFIFTRKTDENGIPF